MKPTFAEQCYHWEWWIFLLLVYALPLHEAAKNVLWGILVVLWLLRCVLERKWPRVGMMGGVTLFWLAVGIWASFFAIEPYVSWKGFWDMLRGAVMLWIAVPLLEDEKAQMTLVRHLVLSAGVASLVGLTDYFWTTVVLRQFIPGLHVQLHSVGHYNQSGIYLAMIWMMALAGAIDGRVVRRSWLDGMAVIFIGLALFGTTARSAIGVALLGSLIILLESKPPRWMVIGLGMGMVVVMIVIATSPALRNRTFFQGSFSQRVLIWQSAWKMMETRPWTGVGLNNFKNINLRTDDPNRIGTVDHAHNEYFNTLAQMGISGVGALLALLTVSANLIWKHRPMLAGEGLCFYVAGGAWWVIVLNGLSNTTLHHEMSMLFFIVMGLVVQTKHTARSYFKTWGVATRPPKKGF